MKKIIAIITAVVMSLLCVLPCSAQIVDDRTNGCTFELSDDWIQMGDIGTYTHVMYPVDMIVVESYETNPPVPVELIDKEYMDEFFKNTFTTDAIAQRISENNDNIDVTVKMLSEDSNIVKSASGRYFYLFTQMYEMSSPGYNDATESIVVLFTVTNGKSYFITYFSDADVRGYSDYINMVESMEFDNDYIEIYVDENQVFPDSEPVIVNSRTLVPIRAVAEEMGYQVEWIGEEQKVVISNDDTTLEFVIGSDVAYKNSTEKIILDVPAAIYSDRTYLPLRAVGEALGAKVEWDGDNIAVDIYSNK